MIISMMLDRNAYNRDINT